jgi:hypothetical protein
MTYKEIMDGISTYQKVDQGWMTNCLNIARMQGVLFGSMEEFFSWACCEEEEVSK